MSTFNIDPNKSDTIPNTQLRKNYINSTYISPPLSDATFVIETNKNEPNLSEQLLNQNKRSNISITNNSKVNYNNHTLFAYKNNLYNTYLGSFVDGYPETFVEQYPKQNNSMVFIQNTIFWGSNNKSRYIVNGIGQVINLFSTDFSKTSEFKVSNAYENLNFGSLQAYTIENLTPDNEISINFIVPLFDNSSNNYDNLNSFKVSHNTLTPYQRVISEDELEEITIYSTDIVMNNEVIVRINYSNNYIYNNILIEHPALQYKNLKNLLVLLTPYNQIINL